MLPHMFPHLAVMFPHLASFVSLSFLRRFGARARISPTPFPFCSSLLNSNVRFCLASRSCIVFFDHFRVHRVLFVWLFYLRVRNTSFYYAPFFAFLLVKFGPRNPGGPPFCLWMQWQSETAVICKVSWPDVFWFLCDWWPWLLYIV